jgi:hypothetical protein
LIGSPLPGRVNTWIWDGSTWTLVDVPTAPPPRSFAAMAYDAARGEVVLFGGLGSFAATLGDTWTWNGASWTEESPATSRPARDSAAIAYDAVRGNALLFGGFAAGQPRDDTWTWDGTTWTMAAPATKPAAHSLPSLVYDAGRQEVVLFGGSNRDLGIVCNDTWTWNGQAWNLELPNASPPARSAAGMAYDAPRQESCSSAATTRPPSDRTERGPGTARCGRRRARLRRHRRRAPARA